jgi:hypothetical protein
MWKPGEWLSKLENDAELAVSYAMIFTITLEEQNAKNTLVVTF